jgi:hypothetical protein
MGQPISRVGAALVGAGSLVSIDTEGASRSLADLIAPTSSWMFLSNFKYNGGIVRHDAVLHFLKGHAQVSS